MHNHRRHAARTPLLAAAVALAFVSPLANTAGRSPVADTDQFIVKFKAGSLEHGNAAQRQRKLDDIGRGQGLHLGQLRRLAVGADVVKSDRALTAAETKALIGRLRADPRVEYAEVDVRVYPLFTPNDASYASQWHYHEATAGINVPGAWDVTTGTGEVIAVIDTGYVAHSDLAANIIAGYDFISSTATANDGGGRDADASDPGDWVVTNECGSNSARNSSWHGTHVAGTIAAVTNNLVGVAGIAYGAKVQPVRVLGKCGGTSSDISDAIVWSAGGTVSGVTNNPTPAKVINLSLGGGGTCLSSTQAAIDAAVALGSTIVIAAGNSNSDAANFQPASCNNILTVAALGRTGARASYSNYGAVVDIAAPGGDSPDAVLSTLNAGTTVPAAESYAGYQGTSMAAPHVAGVAALVRAAGGASLTPAEMKSLLESTSRTLPVACPEGCGVGLVDAATAVAAAGGPVLTISDPLTVDEGNSGTHTVTFTVNLSEVLATDVTFDMATVNGTATAGSDYVALSSPGLVIPAGETSETFVVTVNGDTAVEDNETFTAELANIVGAVTVLDDTGTATIQNDDAIVLSNGVPITGLADAVVDHKTYFSMQVPSGATNLLFTIAGGTGDADLYIKYNAVPTELSGGFDCRPFSGGNNESCPMTAQAGTWHGMLDTFSAYTGVTLTGSYTVPVDISIGDASVTEGNSGTKVITFTVSLSGAATSAVTYDIHTLDAEGTATAPSDYVSRSLIAESIAAGVTSKTFTVTVNGDTAVEGNETIPVEIYNISGANLIDSMGIGTLTNDDGPLLSVNDTLVTEGNSGTKVMTFTVSLSSASASPVTYDIATSNGSATAGSDYVSNTLVAQSIPAGQLSKTFSVTINGDTALEQNETVRANLSNGSVTIADNQGTGTIVTDDGVVMSIADNGFVEGNSGTKILNFTVSLSQASPTAVTYNITTNNGMATAGTDFVGSTLTAQTIPAGQLTKVFAVTVNGDTAVEGNETMFVNITGANVTIADSQAKGTLVNDDGPTLSISDGSVTEGNSGNSVIFFTVSISQVAPAPVTFTFSTVSGTALAGPDFTPVSGQVVTIPTGQLARMVAISIRGDTTVEPDETVQAAISLGNVSIKDGVGIGTIINDD